jgi:uncharacterized protein YbjT (DUF2867 family)
MENDLLLLTGANGRTGRAILAAMKEQGVPVRAFIRSKAQGDELTALGARDIAVGDMQDQASIAAAMEGVTKVLHIGPPMHPEEVAITENFIRAAQTAGADHFIYYSVMHPLRRDVRHHRLKLDAEEMLVGSGLPYTIVQPSRYMQHLAPIWPRVVEEAIHAMPFSVEQKFSVVDLDDLATACATVASSSDHFYATYELAGPEALSQTDMAAIISDVLGSRITAEAVPLEKVAAKARAAGANEDRVEQMLAMNRHYDTHGFCGNPNILEYLLGRPATRFRSYVESLARN